MSHEDLVRLERKSGTIPSGQLRTVIIRDEYQTWCRTLATDRGFKERVEEGMLIRLLDAFVWRSQGSSTRHIQPCSG